MNNDIKDAISKQDIELIKLHKSVKNLGDIAININNELDNQNNLLTLVDIEVDKETNNLSNVQNRVKYILNTKDNKLKYIIILTIIVIILIVIIVFV